MPDAEKSQHGAAERAGAPEPGSADFTLDAYIEGIRERWPERDIQRHIVCGLPRGFHARSVVEQRAALAKRVPLTGTKWDALVAAMVEHVARLHGHAPPAWVDEPERFLDKTWVVSPGAGDPDALVDVRAGGVPAAWGDTGSTGSRQPRGRTA